MPRRSTKAYVINNVAFVQHPAFAGVWIKTDTSVVKAPCDFCAAVIGEPCRRKSAQRLGEWTGGTHYKRRHAARKLDNMPAAAILVIPTPAEPR